MRQRLEPILDRYGLGAVRRSAVLDGGMFVQPVRIDTDRGRFVLRAAGFRDTPDALTYEADAVNHAHVRGVRCPRVLVDRDGRLVAEHDGVLWTVWTFLEGDVRTWPQWWRMKRQAPQRLSAVAREVARLHAVLADAAPRGDASLDPAHPVIQFDRLDVVRRVWRRDTEALLAAETVPAPRSRDAFGALAERIDDHWAWLARRVDALGVPRLPRQIVHGDVSPVNLVFEGEGGAAGFIDWDNVHVGLRLYDALGDVLVRPPWDDPRCHRVHFDLIRRYLRAYARACVPPAEPRELACAAPFLLARQLEDLRQRLRVVPELPVERDAEYAALIAVRVSLMDELRDRGETELAPDRLAGEN